MKSRMPESNPFKNTRLVYDSTNSYELFPSSASTEKYGNRFAASSNILALADSSSMNVSLISKDLDDLCEPYKIQIGSKIECLAFNSCVSNHLAVGCVDGTLKLFALDLATDRRRNGIEPYLCLKTDGSCSLHACFHLSAPSILATSGSSSIYIWDQIKAEQPILSHTLQDASLSISSLSWSYWGDLLVFSDRNGTLHAHDLRSPMTSAFMTESCHGKNASMRAIWANDSNFIITTGANSFVREREFAIWDIRSITKSPIKRHRIGGPLGSGYLVPILDQGSNLLFLCGSNDVSIHMFHFSPSCGLVSAMDSCIYNMKNSERAWEYAILPKRSCDVCNAEVARLFRLTETGIQAIRAEVPRKDFNRFPEELFPYYPSPVQNLSAEDWLSGQSEPPRVSPISPNPSKLCITATSNQASESVASRQDPGKAMLVNNEIALTVAELSKKAYKNTASWRVSNSNKFRHVYGTDGQCSVTGLSPNITCKDSHILACSTEFWAVPWIGGGGPVFVTPLNTSGRVPPHCTALLNGHKMPVNALDFSPMYPNILASGGEDGYLVIWQIPLEGPKELIGAEDSAAKLLVGKYSLRQLRWHPFIQSAILSIENSTNARIFDLEAEVEAISIALTSVPNCVDFDSLGNLAGFTCQDSKIRLVDSRSGSVTNELISSGGVQKQICFGRGVSDRHFITTGTKFGQRLLSSWDIRFMDKPVETLVVDTGTGTLLPSICPSTGILLLASRGDSVIRCYQINSGKLLPCQEYRTATGGGLCGGNLIPPSPLSRDVMNVEVARYFRLTESSVDEIRFHLPRSDELQGYFQDDVYIPFLKPSISLPFLEWAAGKDVEYEMCSLQPLNTIPLSQKIEPPSVGPSKAEIFRSEMIQRNIEEQQRVAEFDRLSALANQNAEFTPNLSMGRHPGQCKDGSSSGSEWDD